MEVSTVFQTDPLKLVIRLTKEILQSELTNETSGKPLSVYLISSIARGDFILGKSDIDILFIFANDELDQTMIATVKNFNQKMLVRPKFTSNACRKRYQANDHYRLLNIYTHHRPQIEPTFMLKHLHVVKGIVVFQLYYDIPKICCCKLLRNEVGIPFQ